MIANIPSWPAAAKSRTQEPRVIDRQNMAAVGREPLIVAANMAMAIMVRE